MAIEARSNSWVFHLRSGIEIWISHPKWWLIGIIPCIVSVPVTS